MSDLRIAPGLALPIDMVTEPIGVLANRGRGKSYATHALVEEIHDAGVPVVVLDVKGDWWGLRSSADGKHDGLPFYIFGGDHADLPLEPTAGQLLADLVVDERVSVVLDLSVMSKTKAKSFTVAFAEQLYHRNRDPLFVVVDEADVLIPQRASAETARLLGAMEDIAKRGRGRGIGMAVVTQRPQEVAKSVLDLMDTLILLGMTGPRSLKSISEWISTHVDEDTSAAEVMATLPSLPVGHAWVWSPMQHLLQRVKVRTIRTFDSHVTPKPNEKRRTPQGRVSLDLDALGERIADTIERAKAEDPKALRARVVQLERELAAAKADVPEPVEVRVEVPVLAPEIVDQLEALLEPAVALLGETQETLSKHRMWAEQQLATPKTPRPGRTRPKTDAGVAPGAVVPRAEGAATAAPASPSSDYVHLKAGARRILETLARHHPMRVTKAQLGTLAKFKITGGTFQTYWSTLKRHGLVDDSGTDIGLTQTGMDYVGFVPAAPMTTDELLEQWRSSLKAGARDMLNALVGIHPDGFTREQLASEVGMTATGGTFQTYLSTLRRNGLVDVDDGYVTASDALFLGGRR